MEILKNIVESPIFQLAAFIIAALGVVGGVGGVVYKIAGKYIRGQRLKRYVDGIGDWVDKCLSNEYFQNVRVSNGRRQRMTSLRMRGSFILHGDAGSGKSMLLRYHYIQTRGLKGKTLCRFFNAEEIAGLKNEDFEKINKEASDNGFSRVILYFDGIDEAINANTQFFYGLRNSFNACKLIVRISCRDEFFSQITESELQKKLKMFDNIYSTVKWKKRELTKYALALATDKSKNERKKYVEYFESVTDTEWDKIDRNPLMCRMLFDIVCRNINYRIDSNRYSFYMSFFNEKVLVDIPAKDKELAEFAYAVFYSHSHKTELKYNDKFKEILKDPISNDRALFIHETFREFLIAFYYISGLFLDNEKAVEVLSCAYVNGISDFTTAGLLLLDEKQVTDKLEEIYLHTVKAQNKKIKRKIKLKAALNKLTPEQYFRVKYEIIFRLGRLHYGSIESRQEVISILEQIYNEDNNIPQIPAADQSYWIVVLKRCCAISSAFLGGYKIEIDYVSRMIDKNSEYDRNYDLANRSHTLYYYGDIINDNDIFGYIDNAADCSCNKALHKRIDRLSEINKCDSIKSMTDKQRRKYYFRLFDIATVYTFIRSRLHNPALLNLSDSDKKILRQFKTNFVDPADVNNIRARLIAEIKDYTVSLVDERL